MPLVRLAGYESAKAVQKAPLPPGSPFVELIDFYNFMGVLGPARIEDSNFHSLSWRMAK